MSVQEYVVSTFHISILKMKMSDFHQSVKIRCGFQSVFLVSLNAEMRVQLNWKVSLEGKYYPQCVLYSPLFAVCCLVYFYIYIISFFIRVSHRSCTESLILLTALSSTLKKIVQGVDGVKQETAGKDVSLVLGTWDQQGSWHVSLECYLTERVA